MKKRKRMKWLFLALLIIAAMVQPAVYAGESSDPAAALSKSQNVAGQEKTQITEEQDAEAQKNDEVQKDAASDAAPASGQKAEDTQHSYPACTLNTKADDGRAVRIHAPEGAFPVGVQVSVTKMQGKSILVALEKAAGVSDLTSEQVAAYDFDFYVKGGKHNLEPRKAVTIRIDLPECGKHETVQAYHLTENLAAEREQVSLDSASDAAVLTTDKFSGHAIVLSGAENASNDSYKIDYDPQTDIHSITTADGTRIILYCMNNGLHWPHATSSTPNVPLYTETTLEKFCEEGGVADKAADLKMRVQNVLYAGYPYNGYGLYQIVDSPSSLSEEEFDQLLVPPQYLRTDFPNSIGNQSFSYADRTSADKTALLEKFLQEAGSYYGGGTTKSGMTYQQLTQLPFWRAAYCMVYFSGDPVDSYSSLFLADYYVTESQAYTSTSNAIWTLMYEAGVSNNSAVDKTGLTGRLLDADSKNMILTEAPKAENVKVTGDTSFSYSTADKKWHTGRLVLSAPSNYSTSFTLKLPEGIAEENGITQIKAGDSFSLVSSVRPSDNVSMTLSSTVPWMEPNPKVYTAAGNVTASDGKGYQNMIGAVIHQAKISRSVTLSTASAGFTFTKVWDDQNNRDGLRPDIDTFTSKIHLLANGTTEITDCTPKVADQGDGTWTVTYSGLPAKVDGEEASYTVKEDAMAPYAADADSVSGGGTITNKYTPEKTEVAGTKTWHDADNQDGKRPESITVRLLANGTPVDSLTVKADADGNWNYRFTDLPKNENGKAITYTVTEDAVTDYSTEIAGGQITNAYTPGKTSITVTKAWKDGNDQDGVRPKQVQVQLYADGQPSGDPVTLTDKDQWTHTWTGLDEKASGSEIDYTVRELSKASGYTSDIVGNAQKGYIITNTHTPAVTAFRFTKQWEDHGDKAGMRPDAKSFAHSLSLLDGEGRVTGFVPEIKDNGDNTYTVVYTGLPKYRSGKTIDYCVRENSVKGYAQSTSRVRNGGTLVNTLENTKVKKTTAAVSGSSPKTGSRFPTFLYGVAGASALLALVFLFLGRRRSARHE